MLCETCQVREATVHISSAVGGEPDRSSHQDLCDECAQRGESLAGFIPTEKLEDQHCFYCGAPATTGEPAEMPIPGKTTSWRYFCEPCQKEKFRFLLEQAPGLKSSSMSPAEMKAFAEAFARIDDHMKRWVAGRIPPGSTS